MTANPHTHAPLGGLRSASLNEDASTSIDLGPLVSDVETSDANLSYTIVAAPAHGSLSGSGQSRTYAPNANYNGTDSFTYYVTDRGDPDNCGAPSASCDGPESSATKTVSITVNPVNDKPTALASPVTTGSYLVGRPPHISYHPTANYNGAASFKFNVTDRGDPDNCGTPST